MGKVAIRINKRSIVYDLIEIQKRIESRTLSERDKQHLRTLGPEWEFITSSLTTPEAALPQESGTASSTSTTRARSNNPDLNSGRSGI